MVRLFSGYYRRRDKALLGFRAVRENDPLLPDAGTWRNKHVYEGISDSDLATTWRTRSMRVVGLNVSLRRTISIPEFNRA